MLSQRRAFTESRVAVRARVRPLARVNPLVLCETTGIDEGLLALIAAVRPFASVDTSMHRDLRSRAESRGTFRTSVRLLARVNPTVHC